MILRHRVQLFFLTNHIYNYGYMTQIRTDARHAIAIACVTRINYAFGVERAVELAFLTSELLIT